MFSKWRSNAPAKINSVRLMLGAALALSLAGCSSFGANGPSSGAILASADKPFAAATIAVVPLSEDVARQLIAGETRSRFSESFQETEISGALIGNGDVLEITLWEAPPAVLFGSAPTGLLSSSVATSQSLSQPGQVVDANGQITVPFAGSIQASGRTPSEIERDIVARLRGKAHQPQASVRVVRNQATNANVVGDVATSGRIPLSPKGERILDVLASAGGVKNPVSKTMIQLSRGDRVASMPLEAVIRDPSQNVVVQPDDVVTVYYQPYSFTAMGAIGNNSELPFEATGISLSQALGRVGGLRDDRADVRGVFLFRLEDPAKLGRQLPANARLTPDGKLPIIYRLDLKDPGSFFAAQSFPMRNKDILYVSNAPLADLQKFMNMVSSAAFSVIGVANAVENGQ
ncbi:MAG TPA: polysaccharide biosynthesis/export family protein [Sphingomicrobium sp.]|nr:polysaccharide biosynthesis/export family protein [Sphingomicrobium sp.]